MGSELSDSFGISGYHPSDDNDESAVGTLSSEEEDDINSEQSDAISEHLEAKEKAGVEREEPGIAMFSQTLLTENMEKGKAARKQLSKKWHTSCVM